MRLLVTGRSGQVATALAEAAVGRRSLSLSHAARPEIDLERPGELAAAIAAARPDVVVNAAAYTAVDRAEDEPQRALRLNAEAAGEAAAAARRVGARLIHLSTDYVFDGSARSPIREDAPTAPLSVYGASKLGGEERVRDADLDALILRTSWVVSPFGHNFVKTMLRLAGERDEVRVVADQHGSPTEAVALARALLEIAERLLGEGRGAAGGTYHLTGSGATTWAGLAERVFQASGAAGGPVATVRPITTAEFPTPAARPAYSILDCRAVRERFGAALPPWQESIDGLVQRLVCPRPG